MTTRAQLEALLERVKACTEYDWRLEDEIIDALGGQIRKVTRLGLKGRTPGRYVVVWPDDPRPKALPRFTADQVSMAKAVKRLSAKLSSLPEEA